MGAGWVAGVTRARALRTRCLGAEGIREAAASPTLEDALRYLAATPYRHDVTPGATPAEAQRAVAATLLWHLRVLAGWQPANGAEAVRALAAGFELSNAEHHLRALAADPRQPGSERLHPQPYRLGTLATAWTRLARTRTPTELRTALAASVWGDPGGDSPAAV
ncbi:V-type ATPase subunit, partial [Streptomyces sp. T21Q-yed]